MELEIAGLRAAVDQNAVPVDLKIGADANAPRTDGQLAAEIGGDGLGEASGETHVVEDANPLAWSCGAALRRTGEGTRPHAGYLSFDKRRSRFDSRLRRRVHTRCSEVLDFPVHQQAQRASAIGLPQIKDEAVRLGEAFERKQIEIADVFVREKIGEKVVALIIPGSGGRFRFAAGHNFEFGIGRGAGEVFVGIDLFVRGVVHGYEFDRVKIDDLFHGFHHAETEGSAWTDLEGSPYT